MDALETVQHIKDKAAARSLLPTEKDFIGRPGYERKYTGGVDHSGNPKYKWRYKYRPNVDGKWTKEGAEVMERLRPFQRADSERHLKLEAARNRVKVRDNDGAVRYLDPAVADAAAKRNGWKHAISGKRAQIERGPEGQLWKLEHDGWRPLGRWCLSEPWTQAGKPKGGRSDGSMVSRGVQHDPDGVPWRCIAGEWRSLG